ncbi:MAG: PEP-CTERM sorting domain-containing protein [Candidatus Sulfotelmatobacter sp.]
MKRVLWMVLLTFALPMAAFAANVDFTNSGGTLTGGNSGLSLSGDVVTTITGLTPGTLTGANLGSVAFTTGAFVTGNAMNGGTFGSGGSFTITAENIPGIANGTTIFTGTFDCAGSNLCTWQTGNSMNPNGNHQYVLTGTISGTWYTGATVSGMVTQLTVKTGTAYFDGMVAVSSGDTSITTPEPGSLMLMGTGLVGLAGALRRKLKA